MFDLIWFLLIGLAAGWAGTSIMGAGGAGPITMMIVGVAGSYVGPILLRVIGFKTVGFPASLVAAVVGAIVCIVLLRYLGPQV